MDDPAGLQGEPDYLERSDESGPPQRGPNPLLIGLVVVVLLAGIGAFVVKRHTASPTPSAVPSTVEVTPEAPWDGKQTRRLPVSVTPDTGLTDGQVVTIEGQGFPPGKTVAAVVCTLAATTQGADACDIGSSSFMAGTNTVVDGQGRFTIHYAVRQHPTIAGQTVDCGKGNIDPAAYHDAVVAHGPMIPVVTPGAFSCLVAVGAIDDYDQSGGAVVAFAGEHYLPFEVAGPTTVPPDPTTTVPVAGVSPTTDVTSPPVSSTTVPPGSCTQVEVIRPVAPYPPSTGPDGTATTVPDPTTSEPPCPPS